VLLDLVRDEYIGFSPEQSLALSAVVEDWPQILHAMPDGYRPEESAEVANEAFQNGLLVQNDGPRAPDSVVPLTHLARPEVTAELIMVGEMRWAHVRPAHVAVFLVAVITVLPLLAFSGLPGAVARASRKRRASSARNVRELISSYYHLRMFFYAPKGRCLFDSVVLLEFLRYFGVTPRWIIGVQVRPFAAHSWLQMGESVLNGTAEYVRAYQQILVV